MGLPSVAGWSKALPLAVCCLSSLSGFDSPGVWWLFWPGYSCFLHLLPHASHYLAAIWQKSDDYSIFQISSLGMSLPPPPPSPPPPPPPLFSPINIPNIFEGMCRFGMEHRTFFLSLISNIAIFSAFRHSPPPPPPRVNVLGISLGGGSDRQCTSCVWIAGFVISMLSMQALVRGLV